MAADRADRGNAALDAAIDAKPRVFGPQTKLDALLDLWDRGLPPGDKPGWPSVDRLYTVAPGQFTVITGWPGSGKSEWLDALLVNLTRQAWKIVYFSPENSPVEIHMQKLAEKFAGMPFGAGPTERIPRDAVAEYVDEMQQAFGFIEFDGGELTAQGVIEAATPWLNAQPPDSKLGLVIDPWNELMHWRPGNLSETEYVSQTLSFVRNWARKNNTHVWIVAHPQKMRRDDGGKLPIPKPDGISGSAHWWNKSDVAITIHRDMNNLKSPDVDVYVHKVRFKHIGQPGMATLHYDRVTGRYSEPRGTADFAIVPSRQR